MPNFPDSPCSIYCRRKNCNNLKQGFLAANATNVRNVRSLRNVRNVTGTNVRYRRNVRDVRIASSSQ